MSHLSATLDSLSDSVRSKASVVETQSTIHYKRTQDTIKSSEQEHFPHHEYDEQEISGDTTGKLKEAKAESASVHLNSTDMHGSIKDNGRGIRSSDASARQGPLDASRENTWAVAGSEASATNDARQPRHEPAEPTAQTTLEEDSQGHPAPSWDTASEHVATVALQSLNRDKDMEMSYVSLLSALTVLQSSQDQPPELDPVQPVDTNLLKSKRKIARMFSQILSIICRSNVAEGLEKETLRQGIMSPEALYTQFYGSIQQAGYDLEDGAHLAMARYWVERRKIEEAQECLAHIDPAAWTGPVYREAITCLLFSKPRHLQEAESLLKKYIESTKGNNDESKIRKWYKLQIDASKWDDVKAQYERRRIRLVEGPSNTERLSTESRLTPQALQQHEQQGPPSKHLGHIRSRSITSSTTTSSYRRSPSSQYAPSEPRKSAGYQRTPAMAPSWPSGASPSVAPSVAPSWPSGASSSGPPAVAPSWPSGASSSGAPSGAPSVPPSWPSGASSSGAPSLAPSWPSGAPSGSSSPASAPAKGTFSFLSSLKFAMSNDTETPPTPSTALPSRLNVNRHLTVLDNGMLEECMNFNEFEYGWKHIYEKMGPTLEDSDTTKIAMRLCRRAFLGLNSGSDQTQPGSLNLTARDIQFNDELLLEGTVPDTNKDAEIWETRAWMIYNKTMMNPQTLLLNGAGSTSHSQASTGSAGGHSATGGASLPAHPNATPLSAFFHDILTIAVHSPEVSSRYLKAFKVYSAMRSEQHYHHLLREPFVMSCMMKGIYDAALAVIHNPEQNVFPPSEKRTEATRHHRRSSSLSLHTTQPMTLGPLMDLAFEIYADLRNVGPIRHLPSLMILAPSSPVNKSSKSPTLTASSASSTVDPLELGTASVISVSPRSSFTVMSMPVFQDLNPTLKPNLQARRLPAEIYLAILHLSIHVPAYRISSRVVRTVIDDMERPRSYLDHHISAALQSFHDTWMCSIDVETTEEHESSYIQQNKCHYREWMYKSDEEVQEYIAAYKLSSASEGSGPNGHSEPVTNMVKELDNQQDPESTCNDRLYWDLWSNEDAPLKNMQYSRTKALMLWKHFTQLLL
ncbi:MAG: hypothetical protein J3Q66DRAFT_358462 [Benniella sp.]|nr:MAG: hypothetical protein J3Q66DRAFT_358462 [Benniella sp.]